LILKGGAYVLDFKKWKYYIVYILAVTLVIVVINFSITAVRTQKVDYNEFEAMLTAKKIESVQVGTSKITFMPKNQSDKSKSLFTSNLHDPDLISKLNQAGVKYSGPTGADGTDPISKIFISWIAPILMFVFLGKILFGKLDKRTTPGVMSFGRKNGKIYGENETGKTFEDVAGQEEAKESLMEIVDFLHNPQKYSEIGAKLPKGALLVGPPGTGKTLLAKAVAGEANVPFFSITGSDFVEMFVGMGAARVRDLFRQAEEKAPCIIFIDEIDAIGKSRDLGINNGNDEREQTLNQLLAEMDGFDSSKGVVMLAATNRPEILDKALLRPGRFDRRVIVDRPDITGREAILKVHSKDVKMSLETDLTAIAKATPGAVGADLANIVNEAALRAVKLGRKLVVQEDLQEAVEVIIAGKEKRDRILSDKEKRAVAFHEVGHALAAALLSHANPVHKITIVPRAQGALGYTLQLPDEEKFLVSKEEMYDQITVMLAGRAAEEIKFNLVSTGAANDIEKATETARSMVTMYGMSEKFDMMGLESISSRYLDGKPIQNCSAETSATIDAETLNIIKSAHERAKELLKANEELLAKVAEKLLEKETLMGNEFMEIINAVD
jgi:cell division protease FtsH